MYTSFDTFGSIVSSRYRTLSRAICNVSFLVLLFIFYVSSAEATPQVTYYYTDQYGTVLATSDASGFITANSERKPYGERAAGTEEAGPGYTGHVDDVDTRLTYMQARYYDPAVGRFLSRDPVDISAGNISTFNRYRYADNNPVNVIDPDGRQDCRSCEIAYGGAVGYMLRNDPKRLETWAKGEEAATTARGALDGARAGQAVGAFVDTGNYSKDAVVGAVFTAVTLLVTHGRAHLGPMHGPSPRILGGKQGKHVVGHNNYDGSKGRSILVADPEALGRSAGTGQQVGTTPIGAPGSKERIDYGKMIGYYGDGKGNYSPTNNAIIHYSQDGIHIVPARP